MVERDGRPVAGALNLAGSDALYGRNWGCIEEHRFLHFEACYYRAIDYAISRGLKRVEAGAQGPHKLARGYLAGADLFRALGRRCGPARGGRALPRPRDAGDRPGDRHPGAARPLPPGRRHGVSGERLFPCAGGATTPGTTQPERPPPPARPLLPRRRGNAGGAARSPSPSPKPSSRSERPALEGNERSEERVGVRWGAVGTGPLACAAAAPQDRPRNDRRARGETGWQPPISTRSHRDALEYYLFPLASKQEVRAHGPMIFSSAEGMEITDAAGRTYLDMMSTQTRASSLGLRAGAHRACDLRPAHVAPLCRHLRQRRRCHGPAFGQDRRPRAPAR